MQIVYFIALFLFLYFQNVNHLWKSCRLFAGCLLKRLQISTKGTFSCRAEGSIRYIYIKMVNIHAAILYIIYNICKFTRIAFFILQIKVDWLAYKIMIVIMIVKRIRIMLWLEDLEWWTFMARIPQFVWCTMY